MMHFAGASSVVLTGLLVAALSEARQDEERWSVPTAAEIGTTNERLRARSADRYLVAHGDFDGDGQADRALIEVRRPNGDAAVRVHLAGREDRPLVIKAFPLAQVGSTGISTVNAGSYQPACARGGGVDCDPSTRVTVPRDAISLFIFEGGAVYYWLEGEQVRSLVASV